MASSKIFETGRNSDNSAGATHNFSVLVDPDGTLTLD
jgi:hypothetical protein